MSGAISSTPKFKVKDNAVTHEWLATLVAKPTFDGYFQLSHLQGYRNQRSTKHVNRNQLDQSGKLLGRTPSAMTEIIIWVYPATGGKTSGEEVVGMIMNYRWRTWVKKSSLRILRSRLYKWTRWFINDLTRSSTARRAYCHHGWTYEYMKGSMYHMCRELNISRASWPLAYKVFITLPGTTT